MSVTRSAITGVGGYLPEDVVTNADLSLVVDTSDEWIQERTGIRERRRARPDQPTSDLATEAARRALEAAGRTPADRGVLGFALRCDGNKTDLLYVDGGPASTGTVGHLRMAGKQVFRHAVVNIAEAVEAACANAGIPVSDVDWFVPHQANQRIIKGVGDRLGIDEAKVISTVAVHANTSAASIPLALSVAVGDGRIKPGDLVLLEAMGGGLTWGACAIRM